jgi:death-on-curing protein
MSGGDPIWIDARLAEAVHERQLAEHGGSSGIRDVGMLESALARPINLWSYGDPGVDLPALAAAFAYGIAQNHPFIDGNKRTAYVICRTFLVLNKWDMIGSLGERYSAFIRLAAGELEENALAVWLREHARADQINEPPGQYG